MGQINRGHGKRGGGKITGSRKTSRAYDQNLKAIIIIGRRTLGGEGYKNGTQSVIERE